LTHRRSASNSSAADACRTHSAANYTAAPTRTAGERKSNGQGSYQQCESQTSQLAIDHGALLSVDPQIMWGCLLSCLRGPQQKVTALRQFPNEPQADAVRSPSGCLFVGSSRINPLRRHQA
jgi:hypothetical protein